MRINIQKLFLLLCFTLSSLASVQSQDFIYSQITNTAFLYNPALTGHIPSAYRLTALYRNQWYNIDGGYQNYSFAADMNRFSMTNNNIGLGFMASQEQSMNGRLINNSAIFSWAYHIALDKKQKYYWSIGLQGGMLARRYNTANLKFASGLLGGTNEMISIPTTFNPDLRAGMNWTSYLNRRFSFKMGASYIHIGGITEKLIEDVSTIPAIVVVHGDADYYLSSTMLLQPSFLVVSQGGSRQLNTGMMFFKKFEEGSNQQVFAGVHWRARDAVIGSFGFELNKVRFQVSYDYNTSALAVATDGEGGFELSIGYIGQIARTRHVEDLHQRDYFDMD